MSLHVKYEKLHNIFFGKLDHPEKDCDGKKKQWEHVGFEFDDWMSASPWPARKGIDSRGKCKGEQSG